MDLSINRADQGDRTVVSLGGEIDVYTAPFVRERLDEAVHEGRTNLIVDLTGVRFLDSTGLGVLVGRLKLTRSLGGSLRLVGRDERVLKVFSITGLDKVFEIHPTLDEALAASEAEATSSAAEQGESSPGAAEGARADAEGARSRPASARPEAEGARAASPAKPSDSGA